MDKILIIPIITASLLIGIVIGYLISDNVFLQKSPTVVKIETNTTVPQATESANTSTQSVN